MILSERDLKFLNDLYILQILNSKRIGRLYNSSKYFHRRLKLLKDNGIIREKFILTSNEIVYSLDKNGFKTFGYKNINNSKINIPYNLAESDLYFYEKKNNAFVKFNNHYYFNHKQRKYVLNIEILIKTNKWIFAEINLGDKHLEDKIQKIELYCESKEYEHLFSEFPVILIISDNIDRDKITIKGCVRNKNIVYKFLDYNTVKEWEYHY